MQLNDTHQIFKDYFGPHQNPFAVQRPGRDWRTVHRYSTDHHIRRHLAGEVAVGLRARWYPRLINLDLDHPREQESAVFDRLRELNIRNNQILLISSPSYSTNGNYRIYIKPTYNGRPATLRLNRTVFSRSLAIPSHLPVELYPQLSRVDRLPFGFGSEVLDIATGRVVPMTLEEKIAALDDLEPMPIEELQNTGWITLEPPADAEAAEEAEEAELAGLMDTADAIELERLGLQEHGTRHRCQFEMLYYYWLQNMPLQEAVCRVKIWIRKKHNGYSKTVRAGNWKVVFDEVDRQADKIWRDFRRKISNSAHNRIFACSAADVRIAVGMFHGDVVGQKQMFNLIGYYRAASHHDYVYIPSDVWRTRIASYRTCETFRSWLERRGILESTSYYRKGETCRKYRLNLPISGRDEPLQRNGRNIDNYYEALAAVYGSNRVAIMAITGLNERTLRRYKNVFDRAK